MPENRPTRLLFVCTGNICRSPMARYYAQAYARQRRWWYEVDSASAMGLNDKPADATAQKVMNEVGIDMQDHRCKPLTAELLAWADFVLVMEVVHAAKARDLLPGCDGKVLLLGQFGGMMEIPDPIGGWKGRYRQVRNLIHTSVEAFMDRLPPAAVPPAALTRDDPTEETGETGEV